MEIIPKPAIVICACLLVLAFILFVFAKVIDLICFLMEVKNFMDFHRNQVNKYGVYHSIEAIKNLSERVEDIEEIIPSLCKLGNENDISSDEYFNSLGLIRKSDILKCKTHLSSRTLKMVADKVGEFDVAIVYWTDIEKICPITLEEFKKGVSNENIC